MNRPIRVLVADDHTILREGLVSLLNQSGDCQVVAQAADGMAAIELAHQTHPDVAVLDISIYLFVNAMTTVSAVVFLYSPKTTLASVAVLNMDDAGDIAPAAAMGMMIFYTNAAARLVHVALSRGVLRRTQAWRVR